MDCEEERFSGLGFSAGVMVSDASKLAFPKRKQSFAHSRSASVPPRFSSARAALVSWRREDCFPGFAAGLSRRRTGWRESSQHQHQVFVLDQSRAFIASQLRDLRPTAPQRLTAEPTQSSPSSVSAFKNATSALLSSGLRCSPPCGMCLARFGSSVALLFRPWS